MSSGFSGGGPDFFTAAGGFAGRSPSSSSLINNMNGNNNNSPQVPYRSQIGGILLDPTATSQMALRRPDLIGKRTLAEFQTHQLQQQRQNLLNIPQFHHHQQQQQQNQGLNLYLRSVKPRIYNNTSPISPLEFSGSNILTEIPTTSPPSQANLPSRYQIPIIQQLRSQQNINLTNGNKIPFSNPNLSTLSYPNTIQDRISSGQESELKMMNRLQELEKQLLDDNEDEDQHDEISVITGSEWSETIQSLINPNQKPPISPSPTSSSSSTSSASNASVASPSPKQLLMEAATAISEIKTEVANDIIARLSQCSNPQGNSEQRLVFYMTKAQKSRLNSSSLDPSPVAEIFSTAHMDSIQLLYQHSLPFKLGLMAANLAIIESTVEAVSFHVVDFSIGHGVQYQNLLHLLSLRKSSKPNLVKITAVEDVGKNGGEERLGVVKEKLSQFGKGVGIGVEFNVKSLKVSELSRESLGCDTDEVLVVNLAYTLFKMADESVSTENPRDQLLRRVKGLGPRVTTVVEQEMNCNTAPFVARVNECVGYFGALFDSLDSPLERDNSERVKIEEGLGRKMVNSVACEGRDRVERCEMFGKWRARMGMAGFELKSVSQQVTESLRSRINSGARVNQGFIVKEENGGVCFGWMERTLTVASAWR